MGALHVVGINLELRFGVRRSVVAEQQVFVSLLRVGLLRAGLHEDAPVKDTARLVIKYAVEIFVTVTVWRGVLDDHVVISQLLATQHVQPVKHALGARLGQAHAQVVARQPRAKSDRVERILCGSAQLRVQRRQVKCTVRLILKLDVLNVRPVADAQLGDDVGHTRRLAKREV